MSDSFVVVDIIPFCALYSSWKADVYSHFTSISGQSIYKYGVLPSYDLCVITEPHLKSGGFCTYTSWSIVLLLTVHNLSVIISCDNAKRQLFRTQTTNSWTSLILNVKSKFRLNAVQRLYMMIMLSRHVCVQTLHYSGYLSFSLFWRDISKGL